MRWRSIVPLCFAGLLCATLLTWGCGSSSSSKSDGSTTGGVFGSGGSPGTGGTSSTGGLPETGGVTGAGGTVHTGGTQTTGGISGAGGKVAGDAGPSPEAGSERPATELDSTIDEGADPHDVPLRTDGPTEAGPTSLDTGMLDGAAGEAGTDAPPPTCAALGGFCTRYRWDACPAHYEPTAEGTGHLDCGSSSSSGWCCVPAPSSPCSDTGAGNCVLGESCSGCWKAASGAPACETGRVCCVDNCW
jgi:hypothetical protein